ncbi:MAG: hypothetical protein JWM14_2504 [Chitinophagaceae bacterium]|nr:hypothetical protein [Chitinophagaceae bacterium]
MHPYPYSLYLSQQTYHNQTLTLMRLFSLLLIGFLYLGSGLLKAQNTVINFDVIYDGKSIGTVTASKEVNGNKIVKNLRSNTDAKVLMLSVHVESEVHVKTEGEILTSATAYRHANRGAEDIETTTIKGAGNTYDIVKNGEKIQLTHVGIKFCVTDMYFTEPLGITKVFSSTYGTFLNVKYVSKGVYMITLPDGKTTTFTYVNGKLTEAIATISLGNIIFKRK